MATTAEAAINVVLRRVRDPHGTAHSRSLVLDLLSRCQALVVMKLALVTDELDVQLHPHQQFYGPLSELHPQVGRALHVTDQGRALVAVNWFQLHHADGAWFRMVANRPSMWGMVGRDMLLVSPGTDENRTVSLRYAVQPVPLTAESDILTVPDQHLPVLYDVLEALLLLRQQTDRNALDAVYNRAFGRFTSEQGKRTGAG